MKYIYLILIVLIIGCESTPIDSTKQDIVKGDNNNVCISMFYYDNGTLKIFKDNVHAIHIKKQGREFYFILEKPENDTLLKINMRYIEDVLCDGKINCE